MPKRQNYTNLQFNSLPGWARDHILALEREADAAPELLEAAKIALRVVKNLARSKETAMYKILDHAISKASPTR
jgi:hypothetical protein